MENKICKQCERLLPLSEFYKHKLTSDGHINKCKECTKENVRKYTAKKKKDPEWRFKLKERARLAAKERRKNGYSSYNPNFDKKWTDQDVKCRAASRAAKIDCPKKCQRHHWSYKEAHWEDVIIMKNKDHAKVHRYMTYDEEHKQYRTVHGVLLDSRELAESYYKKVLSIKDGEYSELQKLF